MAIEAFCRRPSTVFEFDHDEREAMKMIREFMIEKGIVGFHEVRINDLKRGRSDSLFARQVLGRRHPQL